MVIVLQPSIIIAIGPFPQLLLKEDLVGMQLKLGLNIHLERAPESFIFNLSNKQKFELFDIFQTDAIYKVNSYGLTSGGEHDLYISNGCKSNNNNYCKKSSYNSGKINLLGENGKTNFQVATYEIYQVVFE